MTKEEAVLILDPDNSEAALARLEYYAGFGGEEAELRIIRDACRVAVKALRGTTTGEPLTLEQLREMDGKPVWVEFEDGSGGLWGIVHISVFEQIVFPNGLHCTIGHPYYGKTYKAYSYPPAHIEQEAWVSVEKKLPDAEEEVRLCCVTTAGHRYQCQGFYVPPGTYRDDSGYSWDWECCEEYDEERDDYLVNPGWYECIHNWDEYSACGITDRVTHWMPLPGLPEEK